MIRVKILIRCNKDVAELLYKACLQETVAEGKSRVRVRVGRQGLLVFFKGSKSSKVAESIRNTIGMLQMAEQAVRILESG
ncbi:MAG: hypothetical protein ACUVQ0_00160 [Thermoproteota archaeon]